jgi:hypothetical protein
VAEPLNCPFCGSTNVSDGEVLSSDPDGGNLATQSECMDCGAIGPKAHLSRDEIDYGSVKSIEAWNTRAPSHAEGALTDAAEVKRLAISIVRNIRDTLNRKAKEFDGEAHPFNDKFGDKPEVLVEAAAKARFCRAFAWEVQESSERPMRELIAAIDRLASRPAPAAVPEGWVLAPVEPTQAMVHAGIHASKANTMDVWRAMLAATQPQSAGKEST